MKNAAPLYQFSLSFLLNSEHIFLNKLRKVKQVLLSKPPAEDDHVRIYAKNDFINRLQSVGFTVKQLDKNYFGEQVFTQYAIYPTSVLYVVSK